MKYEEMPYSRIDFAEETRYLKELMKRFQAAKSAEEQFAVHQEYYKMARHIQTEMTLASTRNSLDTSDAFYDQEKDYYDREYPAYSNLAVEYAKLLLKSPFRKELEEIIGHPAFRNMELAEKSTSEAIIPLKQEENALVSRYEKMMASAAIEWEGQIYNISQMTPFQRSKDRKVRQEAGKKVDAFYASKEKELDEIYDALVKNRTAQAKALGYENFTELGYNRMIRNGNCIACGDEVIDYSEVERYILGLEDKFGVELMQVGYDRWNALSTVQKLEEAGITCVEIKQHSSVLHSPTKLFKGEDP